jgi:hypothetical protein
MKSYLDVVSCSLVKIYRHFEGSSSLHVKSTCARNASNRFLRNIGKFRRGLMVFLFFDLLTCCISSLVDVTRSREVRNVSKDTSAFTSRLNSSDAQKEKTLRFLINSGLFNPSKPGGYFMFHQIQHSEVMSCPHSVFMCFVWSSEQRSIFLPTQP